MIFDFDNELEKKGLKYEDLNAEEREVYNSVADAVKKSAVSIDKLKDAIVRMREGVASDLVKEPDFVYQFFGLVRKANPKNIFLKARLNNYMLIEAILTAPEKAQAMMAQMIAAIPNQTKKTLDTE